MKSEQNGAPGRQIDRRHFLESIAGVGAVAGFGSRMFGRDLHEAVTAAAQTNNVVASGDSLLPDGTSYAAWEQPATFSKTYYVQQATHKVDSNGYRTRFKVKETGL